MAKDIYLILINHYNQTASVDEERLVEQYRKENPFEYEQLKKLWHSKSTISVRNFNTESAWEKVSQKAKPLSDKKKIVLSEKKKIIPLWQRKIWQVAAAVALLVVSMGGYFYLQNATSSSEIVSIQTNSTEANKLVVLDDGSKVWLNSKARLEYPKKFAENNRIVTLIGEAFFEVEKNPNSPFTVKTPDAETTVLGTSFNVNSNEQTTLVSVTTGKVAVRNKTGEEVTILPGFSAKATAEQVTKFATNDNNYLSWKTGVFTFKETNLSTVISSLNSFYKDKIILKDKEEACNITADFNGNNLPDIIKMIELVCNKKATINEDTYIIQ